MGFGEEYDYLFKILLIGDSGVGKTSLFTRFAEGTYKDTYEATIGVDFKVRSLEVDGYAIKLQLWDTAGMERFRTLTPTHYRGSHGVILVYDITQQQSFNNISEWLKEVAAHTDEDVNKIILGNKCDMEPARQVHLDSAKAYARQQGLPLLETSAKDDMNVEAALMTMVADIKSRMPYKPPRSALPEADLDAVLHMNSSTRVDLGSASKELPRKSGCCG